MYKIIITNRAQKHLDKIPLSWRQKIAQAIDDLKDNPFKGKHLQGEFRGTFSIRVWPYRILYSVSKKEITLRILSVGHRQGIYN